MDFERRDTYQQPVLPELDSTAFLDAAMRRLRLPPGALEALDLSDRFASKAEARARACVVLARSTM